MKDVYVVAGGPSLKGFDFSKLEGEDKTCIAVNHSFLFCKPDYICWMDDDFYKQYLGKLEDTGATLVYRPQEKSSPKPDKNKTKVFTVEEFIRDYNMPYDTFAFSGMLGIYIALCLQTLKKYNNIYLLGMDGNTTEKFEDLHFHKQHYEDNMFDPNYLENEFPFNRIVMQQRNAMTSFWKFLQREQSKYKYNLNKVYNLNLETGYKEHNKLNPNKVFL